MQRIFLKKEPKLDIKLEAFSYQRQAFDALKDLEYSAIFHEQGLGKSKIAIDLMLYWLEKKQVDTVLFVVKKSLVNNWKKEFRAHTFMVPKVLSQNRRSNHYAFNSPSRLLLAHFEVLKSEKERFKLFLKTRSVAVILDESAKIKNPNSTLAKVVFELAPLFKKRVIMTGTPSANRPYDIWSQVYFLDQGKSLGSNFQEFKRQADFGNDFYDDLAAQDFFESFIATINKKISRFAVRQTKNSGVIDLPQKKYIKVTTDWETNQYEMYRQVQKEMRVVIMRDGVLMEDNSEEILKRLLRLVQIASNPRLIDENYRSIPKKLVYLRDIVENICSKDEKVIIWTSFTGNVDWLFKELFSFGTCKVHGKIEIDRRNNAIERFSSDHKTKVLVATPGAAKEGLTLTVANHVIFYDRTFSLDDYLQAQDRIHRISQKRTCYVYNLIMQDSIDEWVDLLLQSKHLAAQLAQGDISIDYYKSQISYDFGVIVKNILGINKDNKQRRT